MQNHALMRLLNGNMFDLQGDELERFFIYAYKITRHTRILIAFGIPALFTVGGLREALVLSDANIAMLLRRSILITAMFACAWLIQKRDSIHKRELAGIAWSLLCSSGLMMTAMHEPARMSLVHVVITLKCILLLPHALRVRTAFGVLLALALPLLVALYLHHATPDVWLSYLSFVLTGAAIGLIQRRAQLDSALDLFQLRKRLLARLHTDSLTGILNREGWEVHARRQIMRLAAKGSGYSVIFFDLDHFKRINDHEGHAMGDTMLRHAAQTMLAHSLPGHVLARFGGEEFIVLLPGASEAEAWQHAEHIRQSIKHGPNNLVNMTVSAGVAQARAGGDLGSALTRADAAMLEAKRRGRNQVLRASDLISAATPLLQQRLEAA